MRDTTIQDLRRYMLRDLRALRREIEGFDQVADLWVVPDGLPNSAGTLAMHVAGNLQHYIGAVLGATEYERDRETEFSGAVRPREQVMSELDQAVRIVDSVLSDLDPAKLSMPFPEALRNRELTVRQVLLHVATHLAYHLGQVDYHRRVVTGSSRGVGAMSPAEIAPPG